MIILATLSILAAIVCNLTVGLTLREIDRDSASGTFLLFSPIGAILFMITAFVGSSLFVASLLSIPVLVLCVVFHFNAMQHLDSALDAVLGMASNALCAIFLLLMVINA